LEPKQYKQHWHGLIKDCANVLLSQSEIPTPDKPEPKP